MKRKFRRAVCMGLCALLCAASLTARGATVEKQLKAVYRDIRIVLDGEETTPQDAAGRVVEPFIVDGTTYLPVRAVSEMLGMAVGWDDKTSTVSIASQAALVPDENTSAAPPAPSKNVRVSSAAELVKAIAPDTCITLAAGRYDLSTQVNVKTPHIKWEDDPYNQKESTLIISGVKGLILQGAPGAKAEIVTPWKFAAVLSFSDCNGVTLNNITAGHAVVGKYECDRGVVEFQNTENITVSNGVFYGSGSIGLSLRGCDTANIRDTKITDCSLYGVSINDSQSIFFAGCKIVDNRAYLSAINVSLSQVIFSNCEVSGNKQLQDGVVQAEGDVTFDSCLFKNNAMAGELVNYRAIFNGNLIQIKGCTIEKAGFDDYFDGLIDFGANNKLY